MFLVVTWFNAPGGPAQNVYVLRHVAVLSGSAADAFPSVIGHLGFGAALGATFYVLEARHDPWWITAAAPTSVQQRVLDQTRQAAAAAPAVWALNALIAVTVTVLLRT